MPYLSRFRQDLGSEGRQQEREEKEEDFHRMPGSMRVHKTLLNNPRPRVYSVSFSSVVGG